MIIIEQSLCCDGGNYAGFALESGEFVWKINVSSSEPQISSRKCLFDADTTYYFFLTNV